MEEYTSRIVGNELLILSNGVVILSYNYETDKIVNRVHEDWYHYSEMEWIMHEIRSFIALKRNED